MVTAEELKVQRADCFKLLAACFYEPERELFLDERLCENLAELMTACGSAGAANATAGMKIALVGMSAEELQVEYARLFVGPFELIAPPYGSVYLDQGGMLMGDSTRAVQKFYRENGLDLEVMEVPDHIALELEFMHYLCLLEVEASGNGDQGRVHEYAEKQAQFLHRYLSPWISEFCARIRQGSDNGFYASLADCLEGFIADKSEYYQAALLLEQTGDCQQSGAAA